MPTLGQNLRRLRLEAGYDTQVKFARELGVGSQAVSDWENDRHGTAGLATVIEWAKVLKRPIEDFVVGLDESYDQLRTTYLVTPASTDDSTNSKGGASDRKSVGGRNPVFEQRYQKSKAGALRGAGGAWRGDLREAESALDAAKAAIARVLLEREDDSDAAPGSSKATG